MRERPEADNLVGIFAALTGEAKPAVLARFGGQNFSAFKKALAEAAVAKVGPIGAEIIRLTHDRGAIEAVLRDGAGRARAIAAPIVAEVRDLVGFVR